MRIEILPAIAEKRGIRGVLVHPDENPVVFRHVGLPRGIACGPVRRKTAEHMHAPGFEIIDHGIGAGGREVPVRHGEPPDEDDRLAILVDVARIIEDVELGGEPLPIRLQFRGHGGIVHTRDIVFHAPDEALLRRRLRHMAQHPLGFRARFRVEPLQPGAIHIVFPHPSELLLHRRVIPRREQKGRFAIGGHHISGADKRGGIVFREIRPRVHGEILRGHGVVSRPVFPFPGVGDVVRSAEPPLIAGHHLAFEGRAIHVIFCWSRVARLPQPRDRRLEIRIRKWLVREGDLLDRDLQSIAGAGDDPEVRAAILAFVEEHVRQFEITMDITTAVHA